MAVRILTAATVWALVWGLHSTAWAQQYPLGATNESLAPDVLAQLQKSAPLPSQGLFWADGITQNADLDAYKNAGFNTVVVRLLWMENDNGEISADNLGPQIAFAKEAAKRGLKIIYALPAAPLGSENQIRISPDSSAYLTIWTTWTQSAMEAARQTPNLIGWMLPDDPRGLPIFDDAGFRRYLAANYADSARLNQRWGTGYESFDSISILDVGALVQRWRGYAPQDELTRDEILQRADAAQNPPNTDLAFHPASLMLALYKRDAYRALLSTWTSAVRGFDNRAVFSGALPDYAQCLTLPDGVDYSVPNVSPSVAENDVATHNPQAIDVARRGGQFRAIPLLTVRGGGGLPAGAIPDLLPHWVETALAHGARGAAFDDWAQIRDNPRLLRALTEALQNSKASGAANEDETPVNTTAVLLSPLADGVTLQMGANNLPRGLYGFGDDMVSGEPSSLVWGLRWGTAFGGVDYLSSDDVDAVSLDRYTTILAPQLLDCPPAMAQKLANYVAGGGTLVADLGASATQNGGFANALSPQLTQLFGVFGQFDIRPLTFNINGTQQHPLFPTWSNMMQIRPNLSLTLGDGPNGAAFVGPAGFTPTLTTAIPLAYGPQIVQNLGLVKRPLRVQLSVNNFGQGYAVFAPFRMWTNWRPGQAGFDGFHGDLLARGATVALNTDTMIVPSSALSPLGQTAFPEVINRPNSIDFLDHDAPNQGPQFSILETTGAGDWLWSHAICELPNARDAVLTGGRPAPIENPTDLEARPRPLRLRVALQAGAMARCQQRPIAALNLGGGSLAGQIVEETAKKLTLNLWSNPINFVPSGEKWQPMANNPATFRVTVDAAPDGYGFAPFSRHRALITDFGTPLKGKNEGFKSFEKTAEADANGRLTFEFTSSVCSVQIEPQNAVSSASLATKRR